MSEENTFASELDRLFKELEEAFKNDNVIQASNVMNGLWVMFQIYTTATTTELKELTYLKTPFTFDNGGKYLLTFTHVDGPKIQLKESGGSGYTKPFEEIK